MAREQLERFRLVDQAQEDLRSAGRMLIPDLDAVLEQFYRRALADPVAAAFFADDSRVAHARVAQKAHWTRLLSGDLGEAYFTSIEHIGRVHAAIDLPLELFVSSYALASSDLLERLLAKLGLRLVGPSAARSRRIVSAVESRGGVASGYTQIQQAGSGQILFNTVVDFIETPPEAKDTVREVPSGFVLTSIDTLATLFPSLAEIPLLRSWVRFEAVSPDARFLAGAVGPEGLWVCAGDNGCLCDLGNCCFRCSVPDVLGDSVREQNVLLGCDSDVRSKRVYGDLSNIQLIDDHASVIGIGQAE